MVPRRGRPSVRRGSRCCVGRRAGGVGEAASVATDGAHALERVALDRGQGVGLVEGVDDRHMQVGVVPLVVRATARIGRLDPRSSDVLDLRRAPALSRSWEAVWVTWPALHAQSTSGHSSRTPIVAARSARFTAVDLQETVRPPRIGGPGSGRSVTVLPRVRPEVKWPRTSGTALHAVPRSGPLPSPSAADRRGASTAERKGGGCGPDSLRGRPGAAPRPGPAGRSRSSTGPEPSVTGYFRHPRGSRARRPGERDVPRCLHGADRASGRRRGRPAWLGLHHRPPTAARRLAAAQPSSATGRRAGRSRHPVGGDVEDDVCWRVGAEERRAAVRHARRPTSAP